MEPVWLITGILIGGALVGLAVHLRNQREVAVLETQLEAEKKRSAEQLTAVRETKESLVAELQVAHGTMLEKSEKRLLEQTRSGVTSPIQESLKNVNEKIERLERERAKTSGQLDEQLKALAEGQRLLGTETGALVSALRQPHTRGSWGELELKRVVELAGMVAHCDFVEQSQFDREENTLRPDLIVNLPGGKHVIVDAKAPVGPLLDAYEAKSDEERDLHMNRYAQGLRNHIRKLSAKSYWDQFPATPEFVFLFLPGEHFFSQALQLDPTLIENSAHDAVIVATPTTLIALLKAVSYGWKQEQVAEEARTIAELGRDLYKRIATHLTHFEKAGRNLESAVNAYNSAAGSLESRVLPTARKFTELGITDSGKSLGQAGQIEHSARHLQVDELTQLESTSGNLTETPEHRE